MFGLSWGQIAIIVLVGVFVLGPERIPTAVTWVMTMLRKARTMTAGAQAQLRQEIGPELEELRRQVADLQSLKEIQELRDLRDLHPKRLIGKGILGDEFSGGITGFLGLKEPVTPPTGNTAQVVATADHGVSTVPNAAVPNAAVPAYLPPSMMKLAAPRVVGMTTPTPAVRVLAAGERPPFDADGT
jgi:sec-independent protein translocase protein TatB